MMISVYDYDLVGMLRAVHSPNDFLQYHSSSSDHNTITRNVVPTEKWLTLQRMAGEMRWLSLPLGPSRS